MKISIIVAMSANGVIGKDNTLPWRLPADLRRFKQLTMGHWLILGRKTYESIGRPLSGRNLIVLTRQAGFNPAGVNVAYSIDQALAMAEGNEVFIAGGAQLYRQTLNRCDRMYVTMVEGEYEGDAYFPPVDKSAWLQLSDELHQADEKNPVSYRFQIYERIIRGDRD